MEVFGGFGLCHQQGKRRGKKKKLTPPLISSCRVVITTSPLFSPCRQRQREREREREKEREGEKKAIIFFFLGLPKTRRDISCCVLQKRHSKKKGLPERERPITTSADSVLRIGLGGEGWWWWWWWRRCFSFSCFFFLFVRGPP